ncbi:hypothetical protein LJR231_001573 [Phyllobacterium sp. LjRoot231]|uniref:hypothetical protein n=1 Tax=Phyllobacterium sp. LjRoot231 TaxID=3342289 RepID=UPI003ECC3B3C
MTILQSNAAKGTLPIAYPGYAGQAVTQRHSIVVPANVAANDILEMLPIPPGCRSVELVMDSDDLDTGGAPAITIDVGIMSGDFGSTDPARTIGAEFFAASTLPQAGGVARPTLASAYRVPTSATERSIGIKIKTVAATPVAGTIGLTLTVVA